MILSLPLILFLLKPLEPAEFHFEAELRYMEQVDDNLLETI